MGRCVGRQGTKRTRKKKEPLSTARTLLNDPIPPIPRGWHELKEVLGASFFVIAILPFSITSPPKKELAHLIVLLRGRVCAVVGGYCLMFIYILKEPLSNLGKIVGLQVLGHIADPRKPQILFQVLDLLLHSGSAGASRRAPILDAPLKVPYIGHIRLERRV